MTARPALSAFRARAPWWGGDLQTMRNTVFRKLNPGRFDLPGKRIELPLGDGTGDRLIGVLNEGRTALPLAVLVHGLTGCHESGYMVETARHLIGLGYPVLRLNMRGAGPSGVLCSERYHAGRGEDIAAALRALDPTYLRNGVVLVGYSLGGNIVLNFLATHAPDLPILAAATVSAPLDLAASATRMEAFRNRPYQRYLVRRMRSDWSAATMTPEEHRALDTVRTIREFDNRLVAPRNGFGTAERYYDLCSAGRILNEIDVPTLLIHAIDDPWIPVTTYCEYDWLRNVRLTPAIVNGGGHVGFHDVGDPRNWHNRRIGDYFAAHQA